jgi:hypothetical protein
MGPWLLIAAVLSITGTEHIARAQDDEETEDRVEANPRVNKLMEAAEQARSLRLRAYKGRLDHWIGSPPGTRALARDRLEMFLARRLKELKAHYHLTEAQLKKLQLAGRGDIKRFMDRLHQAARKLEDSQIDDGELRNIDFEIDEATKAMNTEFFGEDSLFYKTTATTLNTEQAADWETALIKENYRRFERAVVQSVTALQRNLGLRAKQTTALAELLVFETRPPKRFGEASELALVLFQASRIPTARIKPIFDEAQWRIMSKWLAPYREGAGGEELLKRHGFVFHSDTNNTSPGLGASEPKQERPQ